ncbi:hypothetical protein A4U94_03695 [Prescottella equi]|uniref:hypothetical protein n=1 Tax=Rhodococcus hoagii TaxID=43767 RepID=UPI0009BFE551|nr:hypothetical protein [Prescottella equi]OQQ29129.1 hypothetical protein A4U94_03695 [Prescottella equi]
MKPTTQFWKNLQDHSFSAYDVAPASFISTLYPLIRESEVRASYLVRAESNDRGTVTWIGAWVTDTHVATLTAPYEARDAEDEDRWADGWGATSIKGWVRPLNQVVGIELARATGGKTQIGTDRVIHPDVVIRFADAGILCLPFTGVETRPRDREAVDKVLAAITLQP